jgi:hypothetical protein
MSDADAKRYRDGLTPLQAGGFGRGSEPLRPCVVCGEALGLRERKVHGGLCALARSAQLKAKQRQRKRLAR